MNKFLDSVYKMMEERNRKRRKAVSDEAKTDKDMHRFTKPIKKRKK